MLAGAGRFTVRSSSVNGSLSEQTHPSSHQLRQSQSLSELVPSSGERPSRRSWASGKNLSSCGRMLAGAETSAARSSSTSAALSELTHAYSRLLRRGQPLRELGLSSGERASHRSWASGISLSSCGRMLAGAGRGCGGCPPTNEGSSDVATSSARLLRRRKPL